MPNYAFSPVIGSGFSDDAAQMQWGAGYNKSVEEGNRAAAEQAQQTQNRWLAQIANIRSQAAQQEAQTQGIEQQSALSQAADARAAAESARRFNVQADISKQDIASKDKQFTFNQDYANQQERKQLDEIANARDLLAPKAKKAKDALDAAEAALETATKYFAQRQRKAGMLMSPGSFRLNPKTQEFEAMPGTKFPPTQNELNDANDNYEQAKGDLQAAKLHRDTAASAFKALQGDATKWSLIVGEDGTVASPRHGMAASTAFLATPSTPAKTAQTPAAGPLRVGKYAVTPADVPPVAPRAFAGPPTPPTPVPIDPMAPGPVAPPVAPPPQVQPPPPTPAASFAFRPPPPVAPPAPPPLPTPAAWAEMQTAPAEFPRVDYAAPATYRNYHQVLDSYDKGRISKTQANAILGAKFNWAQAQASGPEWKTATHWAPNPAGLLGGYTKDSPWE